MKKRTVVRIVAFTIGMMFVSSASLAESDCMRCRQEAYKKVAACNANAKTDSEKSACAKLANELNQACNHGACASQGVK